MAARVWFRERISLDTSWESLHSARSRSAADKPIRTPTCITAPEMRFAVLLAKSFGPTALAAALASGSDTVSPSEGVDRCRNCSVF